MAELHEALEALASSPIRTWTGSEQQNTSEELPRTPKSPLAAGPWSIPPHLLTVPPVRDAAILTIESGKAASRNPSNFEAVLQHGLNLQELVSRLSSSPSDQLTLLHSACEVYRSANDLKLGQTAVVLFNWAVALSDIARLVKPHSSEEAAEYLSTAAIKYSSAVALDPKNPQALNNWALTLQELAALAPQQEREALLYPAVTRFRAAIRLKPDLNLTSRFCYNLGTVLYSHACHIADRLLGGASPVAVASSTGHSTEERRARAAFAHAAAYIMLAYALQPHVKVYEDSILAVQRLLPIPYLRTGTLLVAPPAVASTPEEVWLPAWFAVDSYVLQAVRPPPAEASKIKGAVPQVSVDVVEITSCHVCRDPSLPPGWAIWVGIRDKPEGMFLIAEEREDAEGWVDVLNVLGAISKIEGGAERLQKALMMRRQRQVTPPQPAAATSPPK